MTQPHLIVVNETAERRIHASGAELTVCISGQSFFTGNEAFQKAAEVGRCVEAIKACGLQQDDVSIQNVSTEVESGILTKSSSATYHLCVRCKSLECLGPVLAAVAAQKNTKLAQVSWTFDALSDIKRDLLKAAVKKAKATAQLIVESLSTQCSALHKLAYDFRGLDDHGYAADLSEYDGTIKRRRAARATDLQQLNLAHETKLLVVVAAEFVVAPFDKVG